MISTFLDTRCMPTDNQAPTEKEFCLELDFRSFGSPTKSKPYVGPNALGALNLLDISTNPKYVGFVFGFPMCISCLCV